MYKRVNKNHLAADCTAGLRKKEKSSDRPVVLFVSPKNLSKGEKNELTNQYLSHLPDSMLLSYKESRFLKADSRMANLLTYLLFIKRFIEQLKNYTHVHIIYHSSVSFLFQVAPLLVLSRFFSKALIIDWQNFGQYYRLEESNMLYRRLLKLADIILTPSDYQSRLLRKFNLKAVTLPIVAEFDENNVRTISDLQPKILVPAHLEDIFNYGCLVKAVKLVKQKYPRTEIVITGEGSNKAAIKNSIDELSFGGITFAEPDLLQFQKFDLLLNCYHIEYFSSAMLSAMAQGLPVVTSPVGMITNLIMRENILFYQFNDHSTLADLLIELIENPALVKKLSENSAAYAKKYIADFEPKKRTLFYQHIS